MSDRIAIPAISPAAHDATVQAAAATRRRHEHTTTLWKVELRGERTSEPRLVNAYLWLEIEAEDRETAESIANESLPGFDWKFTSNYGATEVEQ